MHLPLYLPYACLYAFHCLLALCMLLCISLSTFRLCSWSCGDELRVLLLYLKGYDFAAGAAGTYHAEGRAPAASKQDTSFMLACKFPRASYARARRKARSLRISLCTFPLHASMHQTLYFPCACLYAFHCLLSLCIHLCTCLRTCPMRASMYLTVYFFCVRLYAFQRLLSPCMHLCVSLCTCPMHASVHFTVHFPYTALYAFHCLLSLCC